jgi:hypothetical protein
MALVLAGGLSGCGNGDDAKQQAKNGAMKGVQFGDPKPDPPPEEKKPEPPDVLQVKNKPAPKGLVQNVRAAAYRPERQNELRQIAIYFNLFNDERKKNPKSDEEFIDYIKRDHGALATAIKDKYYILNLKVNVRNANGIVAYESLIDAGGYQAARVDGSVMAIPEDELRKLLMQD